MKMVNLTREQWIQFGVREGYCSAPFCDTHDGPPMADSENEVWDQGGDPCMVYIRVGTQAEWERDAQAYLKIFDIS